MAQFGIGQTLKSKYLSEYVDCRLFKTISVRGAENKIRFFQAFNLNKRMVNMTEKI